MWRSSRAAGQAAVATVQQQPTPHLEERQRQQDISSSQQSGRVPVSQPPSQPAAGQNQSASIAAPATPGRSTYAAAVAVANATVAASPPRLAAGNRPPANSSPAVLTRAMKKRKAQSPADSVVIGQLDGAESSPPTSPASPAPSLLSESGVGSPPAPTPPPLALPPGHVGSPSAPTCPTGDGGMGSPTAPMPPRGPPPPPPWSKFLPAYHGQVICKLCLQRSHGLRFQSCNPCFDKGLLSKSKS